MSRPGRWVAAVIGALALLPAVPWAMEMADFERQIHQLEQGQQPPQLIRGAEFRIGVFTYEDPEGTGLGDPLAALMAHHILLSTEVGSLGVLIFTGGLAPAPGRTLGYFDEVDRVAAAQEVDLAVWGSVRVAGEDLHIETFLQIPERSFDRGFTVQIPLPSSAASDSLTATIRPDRIAAQRLRIPQAGTAELQDAAERVRILRDAPHPDAPVVATLHIGEMFRVVDRTEGWVMLVGARSDAQGWVPLREHCRGACQQLLDAASFASDLVRHMEQRAAPLHVAASLTPEARAVADQVEALDALRRGDAPDRAREIAARWTVPDAAAQGTVHDQVPPGGAAFANIAALARVARARASDAGPSQEEARAIAFDLAEAAQYDPRNADVLHNLAALFAYAGDAERASLARSLATRDGR
jgi:hypothetical protein